MCAAENARVTRLVGQSMPTLEAADKATGRVEYMGDITVPNMAHAKIVRSPFAHATIVSIDATDARALDRFLRQDGFHNVAAAVGVDC